MKRLLLILMFCSATIFAQSEILTNSEVIEMINAGLSKEVILEKINSSVCQFDASTKALIELKKANVDDEIIRLILGKSKIVREIVIKESVQAQTLRETGNYAIQKPFFSPIEALRNARTISIQKSSLQPSRQALEKELLKRPEWKEFNLAITANQESADLYIQISFVHLSLITHRYVYRIYDSQSGTIIVAGETTSWGSLAGNLAKNIIKSLTALKNQTPKEK